MIATGYNRLNKTTEEGGAQPGEYLVKYAADRIRTTSGVWLGITLVVLNVMIINMIRLQLKISIVLCVLRTLKKLVNTGAVIAIPKSEYLRYLSDKNYGELS